MLSLTWYFPSFLQFLWVIFIWQWLWNFCNEYANRQDRRGRSRFRASTRFHPKLREKSRPSEITWFQPKQTTLSKAFENKSDKTTTLHRLYEECGESEAHMVPPTLLHYRKQGWASATAQLKAVKNKLSILKSVLFVVRIQSVALILKKMSELLDDRNRIAAFGCGDVQTVSLPPSASRSELFSNFSQTASFLLSALFFQLLITRVSLSHFKRYGWPLAFGRLKCC